MASMTERTLPLPVKGHLVNQGDTIQGLAERVHVSHQHLCGVLNRKAPLTRNLALAIAAELGLTLDEAALLLGPAATWTPGRRT